MTKQILLPESVKKELSSTFKTKRNELQRALTYTSNSRRANMLRAAALQRGGLIYTGIQATSGFCPNVETTHDHAKGVIIQSFCERITLQINKQTGNAKIIIDGQTVAIFKGVTLSSWSNMLYSLQLIYNRLSI